MKNSGSVNDCITYQLAACSFGLSATSQQYFSLRTNQPPAISQQYFSLRTNQHQPTATSQTNRLSELKAKLLISFFQVHKLLYYVTQNLKVPFYTYNTPVLRNFGGALLPAKPRHAKLWRAISAPHHFACCSLLTYCSAVVL
jgi:hypothetical protein